MWRVVFSGAWLALFGAHTTSSSSGANWGWAARCQTIEPIIMPVLTKEQVFEALVELPEQECAEVVARLSSEESAPPLSKEQEADLREAIREYRQNPRDARPRNAIKAELLSRL